MPDGLIRIESTIVSLRGERVIFDYDLAALYAVETKRLNERVKRNADRFGEKYAFPLTKQELDAWRSQFATSNTGRGGRRYLPCAFTSKFLREWLPNSPYCAASKKPER